METKDDLLGDFLDGVLFEDLELVVITKLSEIHLSHVIIEVENIVGGVVGPGSKTEITHLSSPRPVTVRDSLTQNLELK